MIALAETCTLALPPSTRASASVSSPASSPRQPDTSLRSGPSPVSASSVSAASEPSPVSAAAVCAAVSGAGERASSLVSPTFSA
eukprot:CAMPEP_0180104500 /NCGR_PEP_ID=MMETSP0985-20121206/31485_1 /TAXON_ID=483367 /ORGANISM="non described non described, Strain CCMP 2436" /LENGTH=83 /DNA_ID=CAMNT_0022041347 /DNA_START=71 /DNA_END=319 /DNA_ORIENTATION=-